MQRSGEYASEPTTYYGRQGGVGKTINALQDRQISLRIGVVGLGCGVLATYGRPADQFDMIEINPAVIEIANEHFSFMKDCPSQLRTHLGDGRLVLERMTEAKFDLLVLDAFSSDAIPAHLLTREAISLYRTRLAKTACWRSMFPTITWISCRWCIDWPRMPGWPAAPSIAPVTRPIESAARFG